MKLRPNLPWIKLAPVPSVNPVLTDSQVDSSALADSAVSNAGLQDSSVDSNKLADSVVSTQAIQDSAVTSVKIADSAVDSSELADGAVSTVGLQDSAVDSSKLADGAVSVLGLSDSAVDSSKLSDSAVSTIGLQDSAVTLGKLADSSVDSSKLTDCAVTVNALGDSAVDSTKLADSAVSSAGIQDGTIVSSDMFDTNAQTRIVQILVSDTTLATGDSQYHFFVPAELDSWDLVRAEAAVHVADTLDTTFVTVQVRNVTDAADMLSTKITLDTGEKTSYTAAVASVIDTGNDSVVKGNELAIDLDSVGTAAGLNVILSFKKY